MIFYTDSASLAINILKRSEIMTFSLEKKNPKSCSQLFLNFLNYKKNGVSLRSLTMAMNMLDCLSTKIYLILSCDTTLIREYFCKRCKQIICHGFRWGDFFSSGDGVIQSHRWNDLRRIWCKYVRLPLNH